MILPRPSVTPFPSICSRPARPGSTVSAMKKLAAACGWRIFSVTERRHDYSQRRNFGSRRSRRRVDADASGPARSRRALSRRPVVFGDLSGHRPRSAGLGQWSQATDTLSRIPEVYHEYEPAGAALHYDQSGTDRGNALKYTKPIAAYDADAKAGLSALAQHPDCTGRLATMGVCLGGHLAYRAALNASVSAAACFYPTDIHSSTLGAGKCDDGLARMTDLKAETLFVFGRQDPHVPFAGRETIQPGSKRPAFAMNGTRLTPRTPFSETKARATIQRCSCSASSGSRRCSQERCTALETRSPLRFDPCAALPHRR